ncbi:MAG: hypothetical protein O3A20_10475 [Planctomycetota bacterium]|nr:hypothetical protein [Planctomycetota bacterium]
MNSSSRTRLIWIAIAILAGLLVFTAAPSLLVAAGDSGQGQSEGGNDNPVVGSLPCAVDPDMDLKFFKALGMPPQSGTIMRPLPTLALAGANLPGHVLNAWGNAGSVNGGIGRWSLLGLMEAGAMVTTRTAVKTGQVSMWNWLPASAINGRVLMTSSTGAWNWLITASQFVLPLNMLCNNPANVVDAWFTVTRQNGTPVCRYHVTIVADVVTVEFVP